MYSQDKFEKERRIKKKDVPVIASSFIDSLKFPAKIKWFAEEGATHKSFEAKFTHNHSKHSIEFDTTGAIEDIEIVIDWKSIDTTVSNTILKQLATNCSQPKISKIQMQYTGSASTLFSFLSNTNNTEPLTIKYEIVVRCKEPNAVHLYEYLFDEKGTIESKTKIVFKNSSHLEY